MYTHAYWILISLLYMHSKYLLSYCFVVFIVTFSWIKVYFNYNIVKFISFLHYRFVFVFLQFFCILPLIRKIVTIYIWKFESITFHFRHLNHPELPIFYLFIAFYSIGRSHLFSCWQPIFSELFICSTIFM